MEKLPYFAVCLDPGTRRSLNLCHVPQILAHGEVGSRRRHPRAVTVPVPPPPSATLICRVPPLANGELLCHVPDKRHTAKWPSPSSVRRGLRTANLHAVCFVAFAVCLWHMANGRNPVVVYTKIGTAIHVDYNIVQAITHYHI